MSLNRNTTINLLKVLATALVFCQHSTIICNDELGFILTGFYQQFLNVPAQGGVWMFLTISGLLACTGFENGKYALNKEGILSYYINRIIKILIPTWIFISFAWLIEEKYIFKSFELIQLLTCTYNGSGIPIPGVGATWYIFIVMWLYLFSPAFYKFFNYLECKYKGMEGKLYVTIIIILIIYGIFYRSGCELFHLNKYNWRYANILACVDCFLIGMSTSKLTIHLTDIKNKKKLLYISYVLLIVLITTCTLKNYSILLKAFHALIAPSLFSIICSAIILFSNKKGGECGIIFNHIAPYTLAFYFWHTLVFIHLCHNGSLDSSFESYINVLIKGFVITCYLSFLTTILFNGIINRLSNSLNCKVFHHSQNEN